MTRVVLCGYGRFGRVYARRVREHSQLRLVAVVDPSAAAQAAALQDGCDVFASLDAALRYSLPDVVIVAAPPLHHAALAVEAMQAGADVMLAKPGAVGLDQADTVCAVAWSLGRRVVVDWTPKMSPDWERIIALTDRIVTARFTRRGWLESPQVCGALWDLAPHDVALAVALQPDDRVVSVAAVGWWTDADHEPSGASLHLSHASGRVTRIEVDWIGLVEERRVEVVTESSVVVWDQLEEKREKSEKPDNVTRALDRMLTVVRGAEDDTDTLREVTRILDAAEQDIYRRAHTASFTY